MRLPDGPIPNEENVENGNKKQKTRFRMERNRVS